MNASTIHTLLDNFDDAVDLLVDRLLLGAARNRTDDWLWKKLSTKKKLRTLILRLLNELWTAQLNPLYTLQQLRILSSLDDSDTTSNLLGLAPSVKALSPTSIAPGVSKNWKKIRMPWGDLREFEFERYPASCRAIAASISVRSMLCFLFQKLIT